MAARKTDPMKLLLQRRASRYQTQQKEADVSEETEGKLGAKCNC